MQRSLGDVVQELQDALDTPVRIGDDDVKSDDDRFGTARPEPHWNRAWLWWASTLPRMKTTPRNCC